jgi:hypothetical protein
MKRREYKKVTDATRTMNECGYARRSRMATRESVRGISIRRFHIWDLIYSDESVFENKKEIDVIVYRALSKKNGIFIVNTATNQNRLTLLPLVKIVT